MLGKTETVQGNAGKADGGNKKCWLGHCKRYHMAHFPLQEIQAEMFCKMIGLID